MGLPRIARRLAALGLAAAAASAAVSVAVARGLVARREPPRAEPVPSLPWARVEPLRLRAPDGVELGAWWLDSGGEGPACVVLHGNGGSRAASLGRARALAALGSPSLCVTLRAHGDSGGERNDFGRSARHDVVAAIAWLRAREPGRPVAVVGASLGAAAALLAAAEPGGLADAYVLEAPYRDLATAARNRLAMHLPPPADDVAWLGLRAAGALLEPGLLDLSLERAAAALAPSVPFLVLCGADDEHATCDEASSVARALGGAARLVEFPGAGHDRCFASDRGLWEREVAGLLRRAAR